MKTAAKYICSVMMTLVLALSMTAFTALAADNTMNVTVRIEGIKENLYYKNVQIPYTDKLTAQQALLYVDEQDDNLTIAGADKGFILAINGDIMSSFGGYDGWMYSVNGEMPPVMINDYDLADGDNVVVFYGDPYGIGMQFPEADLSKLSQGIIKFTSKDTIYDANFNPTVQVNPVADATVTWQVGDKTQTYTTDKNGEITISKEHLTLGKHAVQISRVNENGCPELLRFTSDFTVTVDETHLPSTTVTSTTGTTNSTVLATTTADKDTEQSPATGNTGSVGALVLMAAGITLASGIAVKKKK